jgi:actin-related protein
MREGVPNCQNLCDVIYVRSSTGPLSIGPTRVTPKIKTLLSEKYKHSKNIKTAAKKTSISKTFCANLSVSITSS